jgi:Polyketide cyclase / dehydrase and lipid transport
MNELPYTDADLRHSDSVLVACPPQLVYEMIADVTRMGEWSPICVSCWWDESDGPRAGAWFTGRNVTTDKQWDTHCQVTVAEPGREFSFGVGEPDVFWVSWSYALQPEAGGTRLTESWEFLPAGVEMFRQVCGDDADAEIIDRIEAARTGIPVTLAAIKAAAEPPARHD